MIDISSVVNFNQTWVISSCKHLLGGVILDIPYTVKFLDGFYAFVHVDIPKFDASIVTRRYDLIIILRVPRYLIHRLNMFLKIPGLLEGLANIPNIEGPCQGSGGKAILE